MCLQISSVRPWDAWNWSGDEIVHQPIVLASRTIPGTEKRYPIDIREFLSTASNAVISDSLAELIHGLPPGDQSQFRSHGRGSFDLRADRISQFVGSRLRYKSAANVEGRKRDAWLFPDETLAQGFGDCEDLALVLAALLLASGISGYCVRVALGTLLIHLPDGQSQKHDHCWVMYLTEAGVWEILEPMAVVAKRERVSKSRRSGKAMPPTEYLPHYVFNAEHLWRIDSCHARGRKSGHEMRDYCQNRKFWDGFDPSFAAGVHNTIYDRALADLVPASAMGTIRRISLYLDANILTYDPRDHFDNGYIPESWGQVNARLAAFKQNNSDWSSFGAAAHGIGDFYAHSSYLHFAKLNNPGQIDGAAEIYRSDVTMVAEPSYLAGSTDPSLSPFDLTSQQFSMNTELWTGTKEDGAKKWTGKIISGRYAQRYDPRAGWWEGFTSIPQSLAGKPDFGDRGSLPHHNEIAVDEDSLSLKHKLYRSAASDMSDRQAYRNQYRWRVNTAVAHIRQAYLDNRQ